jgi:hypothetical protein
MSRSDMQWALVMFSVGGSKLHFRKDRGTGRETGEGGGEEGTEGGRDNSEKGQREGGI